MATKVLLCKSSHAEKREPKGNWYVFDEAQPYIQGMETGKIAENITAEVLNSMISGVPTPWARARLFGFAFPYTQADANIKTAGLIDFYKKLIEEWKGLIACLACFPEKIKISEAIFLDHSKYENSAGIKNYFYFPNALGRMLFDDKDLWADPNKLENNTEKRPFIQLIYFDGVLIGGTSPYSLVFTAAEYTALNTVINTRELTWFKNGKFVDPLNNAINENQLQTLYLLVKNISKNIQFFEKDINKNRNGKKNLNFLVFKEFIKKWENEITINSNKELIEVGGLDENLDFVFPYTNLFNIDQSVFVDQFGKFTLVENKKVSTIDPQSLLLQGDEVLEILDSNKWQKLKDSAIHYFQIKDIIQGKTRFFTLPFSELGLKVFKTDINSILESDNINTHRIKSSVKGNELTIELILKVDEADFPPIKKIYKISPLSERKNMIMWPNFVSKDWKTYYLYSEFPFNDTSDYQINPFFKDIPTHNFIVDEHDKILYQDTDFSDIKYHDDYVDEHLEIKKLISYPAGQVDVKKHKYEIIKSNKAFAGLEISKEIKGQKNVYGYLLLKNQTDHLKESDNTKNEENRKKKAESLKDYSYSHINLVGVTVGIDFGSNNSCINYRTADNINRPIKFKNRRVFLIGTKKENILADKNELFFFQNEETEKGQIKSWIHEHNPQYIKKGFEGEELAGGLPTFKTNIHINDMDNRKITTNAGFLHHSLKWLLDIEGSNKKTAYLKTVWLHIFADLYADSFFPKELRWAYPGAFAKGEIAKLESIFKDIKYISPVKNRNVGNITIAEPITESEAVSNYAISSFSNDNAILLGIDVGGSTSDVLIIGNTETERKLLKQSSVRLAAGYLTDAIINSKKFKDVLLDFYNNANSPIKGQIPNINKMITEPQTAPFFLNIIFDKLKEEQEHEDLYAYISKTAPLILALPAYITGLLLFYSGQLIAKAVKEHQLSFNEINLLSFGKGGRIFDWLETNETDSVHVQKEDDWGQGLGDVDNSDISKEDDWGENLNGLDGSDTELKEDLKSEENNEVPPLQDNLEDTATEGFENFKDTEYVETRNPKDIENNKTKKYFADCIRAGFGEKIILKNGKIVDPDKFIIIKEKEIRINNKSEVAIGLTSPNFVQVDDKVRANSDIFGEENFGFKVKNKAGKIALQRIPKDYAVQSAFFNNDLQRLRFPREFSNLNKFLDIYLDYIRNKGIVGDITTLKTKKEEVGRKITQYIMRDKEFLKSRASGNFGFKHSMLILEGMCYMEEFLIPEVYKS